MAATAFIDVELSGRGNGWTVLADTIAGSISMERGFPGASITDLVAGAGSLRWSQNNTASNSVSTLGYYSPDHASTLVGWKESIGVRYRIHIGSTDYVRFTGTIETITPVAGLRRDRKVHCEAVGWMDTAGNTRISEIPIQIDQRNDQLLTTLLASIPIYTQPLAVQLGTGLDTYPYVFDKTRDEGTVLREELVRMALSGLDRFWVNGSGTLVYEPRNYRIGLASNVDTFTDSHGLAVSRTRNSIINNAHVTANPRKVGVAASVLYSLNNPVKLTPGDPKTILGPWRDPDNPDTRVGAINLIDPVATTDYLINDQEDGLGNNLTAYVTVTVGVSGNATRFDITSSSPKDCWVIFLQQRGQPLLDYGSTQSDADDATSISLHGDRPSNINMAYQADLNLTQEAAQYIVFTRKGYKTVVTGFVRKAALTDTTDVLRSINRDVSDRIRITDTVTGVNKSFFIEHITEEYGIGVITTTWLLSPVDETAYWHLEVVGQSELDSTTTLGFGYILGHTDVAHADVSHTDTHSDVSHSDTHSDSAHSDVAHGDGASHGDSAHSDSAHSDVSHSDVTHSDAYTDTAHSDDKHSDFHSDVEHDDVYNDDTAHLDFYDSTHNDIAHDDTYGDLPYDDVHDDGVGHIDYFDIIYNDFTGGHDDFHSDVDHTDVYADNAHSDHTDGVGHVDGELHGDDHTDSLHSDVHGDSAHSDTAHADSHGDVTHGDVSHGDVSHGDVAHSDDAGHSDLAHSDVAHSDVAHSDVSHTDTHGDVTHEDVPHGDVN